MGSREVSIEGVNKFRLTNDNMQIWKLLPFGKQTKNHKNLFVIGAPGREERHDMAGKHCKK